MAGVTDASYRTVCKKHGAELVVSEMVSAKAIHYKDENTKLLSRITKKEQPMAVQLFGSEPEIIAEAVKYLSDMPERPAAIDINMGCPVKKIVSNGEGSALMKNPERAAEIVYAAVRATDLPITVKTRAGFDSLLVMTGVTGLPEIAATERIVSLEGTRLARSSRRAAAHPRSV